MFKFFTKALNDERGFTLVELIVVIAIIAILALIAVPRFGGFSESAKVEADKATAKTIENAINMYIATAEDEVEDWGAVISGTAEGAPAGFADLLDLDEVGKPQSADAADDWIITEDGSGGVEVTFLKPTT